MPTQTTSSGTSPFATGDADEDGAELPALPAPRTIEATGIRTALIDDIAIKTIARDRQVTTPGLAEALALSQPVVDDVFARLRKAQLVEVLGMSGTAYRMSLTSSGKARADDLMATNQYVGPVPVSLEAYAESVRLQSIASARVRPEAVRRAFAGLVLGDDVVRQIGIGVASGMPIMLYGPSGTGKTSIAERIPLVFQGGVFIPHALEVNGEIIRIFDPGVHRVYPGAVSAQHDRRWVYCDRPFVIAGGELTAESLDLQYNAVSGFYTAPPQVKANTGVFVIDDFGRQRMRPEELLNRWVVPLDRGVDHLTLHGGAKFTVPFAVLVVFATNLDPAGGFVGDAGLALSDAVFLRRIPNKVHIGHASRDQFHEISRRACADAGLSYDSALVDRLIELLSSHVKEPLRPCIPRDLVRQITWESRYEGRPPVLNSASMARACRAYFAATPVGSPFGGDGPESA